MPAAVLADTSRRSGEQAALIEQRVGVSIDLRRHTTFHGKFSAVLSRSKFLGLIVICASRSCEARARQQKSSAVSGRVPGARAGSDRPVQAGAADGGRRRHLYRSGFEVPGSRDRGLDAIPSNDGGSNFDGLTADVRACRACKPYARDVEKERGDTSSKLKEFARCRYAGAPASDEATTMRAGGARHNTARDRHLAAALG